MSDAHTPLLSVVRGEPTAEELAALVTTVTTRTSAPDEAAGRSRHVSAWRDRSRLMQEPPRPGPGAWRASARPR